MREEWLTDPLRSLVGLVSDALGLISGENCVSPSEVHRWRERDRVDLPGPPPAAPPLPHSMADWIEGRSVMHFIT